MKRTAEYWAGILSSKSVIHEGFYVFLYEEFCVLTSDAHTFSVCTAADNIADLTQTWYCEFCTRHVKNFEAKHLCECV